MPELPEVETIARQLSKKIVGKKLDNARVVRVRRRAKLLIIELTESQKTNNYSLVFHLKLTGQLIYNGTPCRYTRKVFNFSDGSRLIFNSIRNFSWYKKVKNTKEIEKNFGPEALEVSFKEFAGRLGKKPKTKLKPLLMDQKFIAGIGNIYADESLFKVGILPARLAGSLNRAEIRKLFNAMRIILKAAIKAHGSSVQHYLDVDGEKGDYEKSHKVYRRTGQKCKKCGSIIKRIKIGGRSAHFCPKCQK